jgi:hypothetical protein
VDLNGKVASASGQLGRKVTVTVSANEWLGLLRWAGSGPKPGTAERALTAIGKALRADRGAQVDVRPGSRPRP